jgi:hypothetical protein
MKHKALLVLVIAIVCVNSIQAQNKKATISFAPVPDTIKVKKTLSISEKIKSSRKVDGLFTLYQDTATGSLQMYVKKDQLNKEYLYQSFSLNGPVSLFLNQSMYRLNFLFRIEKTFDKLEFTRINTSYYYDPASPMSRTRNTDKPDAVFYSDKVNGEDSTGYLVNVDALFISEKMDPVKPVSTPSFFSPLTFNLGSLNTSKSKYFQLRSFPSNTDILVDMAYDNPGAAIGGPEITDPRYVRIRVQHSFIEVPQNDFRPRKDDARVGYFTQQTTDQTSTSPVPYKDKINRWFLQKKDPSAAISEPVEPIVFWVENTTPLEYRQTIIEAGLKWNEAFEKAGFRNAIEMKIMPDTATWDPSDIHYNVIRWVASAQPAYGAIGLNFVNPKTGQVIGADIVIEWATASFTPVIDELYNNAPTPYKFPFTENAGEAGYSITGDNYHYNNCSLAREMRSQFVSALTALDIAGAAPEEIKEMHKQFLTYLIMHEMGHTLGLNHNMKSSQMLSPAEVNNKEITRKIGMLGSVMDYPAVNIALDKSKQGDYYTTKAGPYDLWAIEYGYTPLGESQEEAGLKKILSRSSDPKLAFGNDGDDMRAPGKGMDPRVNVFDLTNDAISYAEDRLKLIDGLMGKLKEKYVRPGNSYAEIRSRYGYLNNQRVQMIGAVSRYIGGVYIDRSYPEQEPSAKPYTPVPLATQKKAMALLAKYVFAPDAFKDDSPVFPYLQVQRRGFNQNIAGDDYRVTTGVLNNQMSAIAHILNAATLQRITNSRLYGNRYSVADVMSDLTKAIFNADLKGDVNVYRQYLQTTFVQVATGILDPKYPGYDDIARAASLYTLKKIKTGLATAVSLNEETKAHRANLLFLINNALENKQ